MEVVGEQASAAIAVAEVRCPSSKRRGLHGALLPSYSAPLLVTVQLLAESAPTSAEERAP